MGELINYGSSKQIEGSQITPSTWVLDLEDIEKNSGKLLQKKYGTKTTSNKSCFRKGDVLYGKLRPYLNKVLIADEDGCCSTEIVPISVSSAKLKIDAEFLSYFLRSPYFVEYANGCAYGVKMPRLGTKDAKSAWVAIPPLAEQHRIVVRLQKIRSLVDTYRREEIQFAQLITEFPDKLKASILQEAIQGKLVPQLESEPKVTQFGSPPKEEPFSIPDKWKWCQIGELATVCSARRVHKCDWKNEGIPFYRAREIAKLADNGFVKNELFITEDLYQSLSLGNKPEEGDLMITAVGTLGKVYVVRQGDKFYYKDASVICLKRSEHIYPDFARILLSSPFMRKQIRDASAGTTVGTITIKRAMEYWIPLPPVEEQRRIARAIKPIFQYIDNIKI